MKPAIPLAVLVALAAPPAFGEDQPALANERWREDWSGSDAAWKDIALAPGLALDIGADARWKPEAIDNPRYGLSSLEDDSWLQQRLLMHFNLRAAGLGRAFVELGAFDVMGRENKGASDDNRIDVQQAFFDLTPHWGDASLRIRLGRQELDLGERFFDLGDSSNIRLHHDAARLTLTHGPWLGEAFVLEQVENDPGAFDDGWVEGQDVFGAQMQRSFGGGLARVFYYQQTRDAFALAGVAGDDQRGSIGVYARGGGDGFDGAVELVRQVGEHGALDIEAWGAYAEIGRSFANAPLSPRLGARITYGSGDGDAADGVVETYAPPFPRGSWFTEAGLVSHSNIVEAAALASLTLRDDIRLDAKLAGLWRASDDDFIYVSSQTALAGTIGGDRYIGVLPRLQLTWRASRHVTVRGEVSMVVVSDDIEALGGESAAYANASLAWRY